MPNQQLTRSPQSGSQLARPSSTSEAAAMMRSFERLSDLPGWAGILHALAQDKRHDLAPHVIELWKVKLAPYRDEDIAQVLVRGEWKFFPSVDEVIYAVEVVAQERRAQREQDKLDQDRRDAEAAREAWQDPKQQAELDQICKDLGRKVEMHRLNNLHKIARRSPENVKALSQAKALRSIGVRDAA